MRSPFVGATPARRREKRVQSRESIVHALSRVFSPRSARARRQAREKSDEDDGLDDRGARGGARGGR